MSSSTIRKLTQEHKDNIRRGMLGKPKSLISRIRLSRARKGIVFSLEHRKNLSEAQKRIGTVPPSRRGVVPWNFKGVSPLVEHIRKSYEYVEWRTAVYIRDSFTCRKCKIVGQKLHAHHIKFFSTIMEENKITNFKMALKCKELWDVNNGLTLCISCHKKEHRRLSLEKK